LPSSAVVKSARLFQKKAGGVLAPARLLKQLYGSTPAGLSQRHASMTLLRLCVMN
jgi:hypothetical protein